MFSLPLDTPVVWDGKANRQYRGARTKRKRCGIRRIEERPAYQAEVVVCTRAQPQAVLVLALEFRSPKTRVRVRVPPAAEYEYDRRNRRLSIITIMVSHFRTVLTTGADLSGVVCSFQEQVRFDSSSAMRTSDGYA